MLIYRKGKASRHSEFLLKEQDEGEKGAPYVPAKERILTTPETGDSLLEREASVDEKIDKYLLQYEKESVPLENKEVPERNSLAERRSRKGLYRFLFEQDAPPDPAAAAPEPPPDPAADAGAGGDSGGDSSGEEKPDSEVEETAPVPKINIRRFAGGVARLANNYETLVDPKTIIINRAMYYISKNYSPRLAKELVNILQRDFDLTTKTISQREAEYPKAPRQGGSGPDDGGGAPAGGGK